MATFNIVWIAEFFAADPVRDDQELGCWHKFKKAYEIALETGVTSFAEYVQLVRHRPDSDAEFRKGDKDNLLAMYNWLHDEKGFSYTFSEEELEYPVPDRRVGAVLDQHTPEELEALIASVQDPMVNNLLTIAMCGIPMLWVEHLESVDGNVLTLTTGAKHVVSDEEARVLSQALASSEARQVFFRKLKAEKLAPVDRFAAIRSAISKVRREEDFPYTFGDLTDYWECNNYCKYGVSFVETVNQRFGTEVSTLYGHPEAWLNDNRISEDTFKSIVKM